VRTIVVTLAYDGTRFVGWQRQPSGESVQELLERALAEIEPGVKVTGAGRTDAGVHAAGQVASFELAHGIDCATLPRALNARLPADVRVLLAEERPHGFNARYGATSKLYRYVVLASPTADPFDARYAWHVPYLLDVDAMEEALGALVGQHDFAAFCGAGSSTLTTERRVLEASCRAVPASGQPSWRPVALDVPRIVFDLVGEGFLRHMVRNIVGTAVEIGKGRWPVERMAEVLASRDRTTAGPTAPPEGLCLVRVSFDVAGAVSPPVPGTDEEG
jgi:tRNA pseudouridine38-40 synthase